MLGTKNLVKTYKPKRGMPVTVFNKVSILFVIIFALSAAGWTVNKLIINHKRKKAQRK